MNNSKDNIHSNQNCDKETTYQSILEALPYISLILNEQGVIICANEKWEKFTRKNNLSAENQSSKTKYIEIIKEIEGQDAEIAKKADEGVKAVTSGRKELFTLESVYPTDKGNHWFKIKVKPFQKGVLVIHENITENKLSKLKYKKLARVNKKKNDLLETTFESIQEGISVINPDFTIRFTNKTMREWHKENAPLKGKKCYKVYANRRSKCLKCPTIKAFETQKAQSGIIKNKLENSKMEYAEVFSYPMFDEKKEEVKRVIEIERDITERRQRKKELQKKKEKIKSQKQRLQSIIEGTNVGTWEWNIQTNEITFNEKWAEIMGYTIKELSPVSIKTWKKLIHPDDLEKVEDLLEKHFQGETNYYDVEIRMKHKNGYWVWIEEQGQVTAWTDKGNPEWMYGIHLNITDRKKREKRIRYTSHHDNTTDLYNRTYMEKEIKKIDTKEKLPVGIIMIDINGLKIINEGYGYEKGNNILIKTAEILRSCIRDEDILARWDGDEFIILLPQTQEKEVQSIMQRIKNKTENTKNNDIPLSFGIGYALKTTFDQNLYETLYEAEDKVYQDKLTQERSKKNKLVKNMLNTLGAKSDETKAHAQRMTKLSYKLGQEVGLSNEGLNQLSLLATLHDIGKVNIAEEILKKPDSLTDKEWKVIKKHTEKGYSIASAIEEFTPIAESILAHHERWDGDGYPQRLAGEDIPLLARIISIVDAYDVMTNGRPYKEPMSKKEALDEIENCAGSQFDPELAKEFIELKTTS